MKMMEACETLIQEATGLLADMEIALVDIEGNGEANKRINDLCRAVHTIKSSSGLFGLDLIVNFTHEMENLLVRVRDNDLIINAELTLLLLGCVDYVGRMINTLSNHEFIDPDPGLRKKLLRNLHEFDAPEFSDQTSTAINTRLAPPMLWQIGMTFSPDILRQGINPTSFIYYLSGMGEIKAIAPHRKNLPTIEALDTAQAYLSFSIQLRSRARQHELEQALKILLNDAEISVARVEDQGINGIVGSADLGDENLNSERGSAVSAFTHS